MSTDVEKIFGSRLQSSSVREYLEASAGVWSVLQMMTPIPTCYRFYKQKSVGEMSATPYTSAVLSCLVWLHYSTLINDQGMVVINAISALMQACYVLVYYIYCMPKRPVHYQISVILFSIIVMIWLHVLIDDEAIKIQVMGMSCCVVNVLFFASPLVKLRHVLRVRNTESLPTLLIIVTFVVSVQWSLYGLLIRDAFVQVPNTMGVVLSGIQLLFICFLPRRATTKLPE